MKQKHSLARPKLLDYVEHKDASVVFSQRVDQQLYFDLEKNLERLGVSKAEFLRASIKRFLSEDVKR